MNSAASIRATVLAPFAYHGLMVQGGSATIANTLSDTSLAFALANVLGWLPSHPGLPHRPSLVNDLRAMPFRCSLLTFDDEAEGPFGVPSNTTPSLLPSRARRLTLDVEVGRPAALDAVVKSGNVKDYFSVQEVPPGHAYRGLVVGANPFELAGTDRLVVRTGLHQAGMLLLEPCDEVKTVRLNAHTAHLFGRSIDCDRYLLHTIQASSEKTVENATLELETWV